MTFCRSNPNKDDCACNVIRDLLQVLTDLDRGENLNLVSDDGNMAAGMGHTVRTC